MKKVFVAALLVVGITAFAQEKEGRKAGREKLTTEQKVDFQVKKMSKDLDLNEKQTQDVKALVNKEVQKKEQKRKEIRETNEKSRKEMRAQMETEQAAVSSEMQKILTPEQFTKWQKIRAEKREKVKEKMADRKEMKELK